MSAARATLRVGNDRGVHGRVATRLAEIAREHNASLRIDRDGEQADCASILEVLALALACGDTVHLEAAGEQAEAALAAAHLVLTRRDDP